MPKLVSSKKRLRQERVRAVRNKSVKSAMRTSIKKVRQTRVASEMPESLSAACSALDKAAKRNVIHRRTASRLKSRLMKMANGLTH
ncbi:MAG: 30S ribosomal protein S20 [candidate division Zixibacteria bacterium]|nr:30S ribosomal protein S20 [candidate division Zixibacteria bacterium]